MPPGVGCVCVCVHVCACGRNGGEVSPVSWGQEPRRGCTRKEKVLNRRWRVCTGVAKKLTPKLRPRVETHQEKKDLSRQRSSQCRR